MEDLDTAFGADVERASPDAEVRALSQSRRYNEKVETRSISEGGNTTFAPDSNFVFVMNTQALNLQEKQSETEAQANSRRSVDEVVDLDESKAEVEEFILKKTGIVIADVSQSTHRLDTACGSRCGGITNALGKKDYHQTADCMVKDGECS